MARFGLTEDQYTAPGFNLLKTIGFSDQQIEEFGYTICGRMTIEGAPHLAKEHLPIFDCANRCGTIGKRYSRPNGPCEDDGGCARLYIWSHIEDDQPSE